MPHTLQRRTFESLPCWAARIPQVSRHMAVLVFLNNLGWERNMWSQRGRPGLLPPCTGVRELDGYGDRGDFVWRTGMRR